MAGTIWEFFGYPTNDVKLNFTEIAEKEFCPYINEKCSKTLSDGKTAGVCSIKPMTSAPVICCPIRLYSDNYKILEDVASQAFSGNLKLVSGKESVQYTQDRGESCIAVFGKGWGGELRIPKKSGLGGYFVDWVLALIDSNGQLKEFVAVEVQTIDTTGSYRKSIDALAAGQGLVKSTVGLNWENVSKRILPQLIYKGQVLQREELCRKGLFFICPSPVYQRIMERLGGDTGLVRYALQPASITFLAYDYKQPEEKPRSTTTTPLSQVTKHSTTVYKVQEAFNNVTLPNENVFRDAILKALE